MQQLLFRSVALFVCNLDTRLTYFVRLPFLYYYIQAPTSSTMLASRRNNTNTIRPPFILPNLGNTTQQQQQPLLPLLQTSLHRPPSADSVQSIDNAYSLEHLFTALRRRIRRIVQTYNAMAFYNALKICARIFRSYASYNLHTIDEFARLLNKSANDNRKLLSLIDQFRLQLSELRHCHSTFEVELLVTTLAIDFHENDSDQQQQQTLPLSTGKFSPRSRFSKFRVHHIRQAIELKSQLKQTNEHLQVLLFDEFNADLSNLWNESEKYVSASIPFHDRHMSYVLRLIPDIALKFEYALQLCTKLFDLETMMVENYPQTNRNYRQQNHTRTPPMLMTLTPRSDYNQQVQDVLHQHVRSTKRSHKSSAFFSADVTSASSVSSVTKLTHPIPSPLPSVRREAPVDVIHPPPPPDDNRVFSLMEKPVVDKNDQSKLRLLIERFDERLMDEEAYRTRLLNCLKQTETKSEQLNQFPKNNMLTLVMSADPAIVEYQKALWLSDYKIHKSVADELSIAIRETQHRIDWINMVRTRAQQCLVR